MIALLISLPQARPGDGLRWIESPAALTGTLFVGRCQLSWDTLPAEIGGGLQRARNGATAVQNELSFNQQAGSADEPHYKDRNGHALSLRQP